MAGPLALIKLVWFLTQAFCLGQANGWTFGPKNEKIDIRSPFDKLSDIERQRQHTMSTSGVPALVTPYKNNDKLCATQS